MSANVILEIEPQADLTPFLIVSVNNSLVCYGIEAYCTDAQKEKYLPKTRRRAIRVDSYLFHN